MELNFVLANRTPELAALELHQISAEEVPNLVKGSPLLQYSL